MIIGGKEYKGHTYIMGILNVTPDSFSDGGKWNQLDLALKHSEQMIQDGAAVIDVGGESTRPGYEMISDDREIERVCPVIERLVREFDVPVSIDTYKSRVARAALVEGASMVNDIWGFQYDIKVADVAAEFEAACCIMHNRRGTQYNDFFQDVLEDLKRSIDIARAAGVRDDGIILDPGIGFSKTLEQNLLITHHMERLSVFGYPLLLAASRKSMIGNTLKLPVEDRLEGTLATTVLAVTKQALFVRVHDVKENKRVIDMTEAILGSE